MAKDSSGTKNQPIFSETGAPQLGTDLSLVSNYAASVGNMKIGTAAERAALSGSDVWEGLEFYTTGTGEIYKYANGAFRLWHTTESMHLTPNANWTETSGFPVNLDVACGFVRLTGAITRTTTAGPISNMLTIPSGRRPLLTTFSYFIGATVSSGNFAGMLVIDPAYNVGFPTSNYLTATVTSGATIPFNCCWQLDSWSGIDVP